MSALRIGVDARAAAEVPAGRGRYVRELLRALSAAGGDERYVLYCRTPMPELGLDERFAWELVGARDPLWHLLAAAPGHARVRRLLVDQQLPDGVVHPDPHRGRRLRPRGLRRGRTGAGAGGAHRARDASPRPCAGRARCCASRRRPRATSSPSTPRSPGAPWSRRSPPTRRSAPPRDDLDEVRGRLGLDRPFVLAVGTLEPRKNLVRLIEAWARLDAAAPRRSCSSGPSGWEFDEILRSARAERVRVLGYVSDDRPRRALRRLCGAFCLPVAVRGLRAAGARGDDGGRPRGHLERLLAARGRRRRRACSSTRSTPRRSPPLSRVSSATPPRRSACAPRGARGRRRSRGRPPRRRPSRRCVPWHADERRACADFSAHAPTPPARWKVRLVRSGARYTPYRIPWVRRHVLAAWRKRKRKRRLAAEARGDFSLSRPALYGMADRLDRYLNDGGFFVEAGAERRLRPVKHLPPRAPAWVARIAR